MVVSELAPAKQPRAPPYASTRYTSRRDMTCQQRGRRFRQELKIGAYTAVSSSHSLLCGTNRKPHEAMEKERQRKKGRRIGCKTINFVQGDDDIPIHLLPQRMKKKKGVYLLLILPSPKTTASLFPFPFPQAVDAAVQ